MFSWIIAHPFPALLLAAGMLAAWLPLGRKGLYAIISTIFVITGLTALLLTGQSTGTVLFPIMLTAAGLMRNTKEQAE